MMETNKKDLRYQRTKSAIIEATVALLEKKTFEEISIKDICEKANISRSGFYLHYTDKYDLAEKYQLELMAQGTKILQANHYTKRNEATLTMLRLLVGEGRMLALLISEKGSVEIQNKIRELVKENAKKNIFPYLQLETKTEVEEKYLLSFLSNAILGVIQEWVKSGQKESPEEMLEIVETILSFSYFFK